MPGQEPVVLKNLSDWIKQRHEVASQLNGLRIKVRELNDLIIAEMHKREDQLPKNPDTGSLTYRVGDIIAELDVTESEKLRPGLRTLTMNNDVSNLRVRLAAARIKFDRLSAIKSRTDEQIDALAKEIDTLTIEIMASSIIRSAAQLYPNRRPTKKGSDQEENMAMQKLLERELGPADARTAAPVFQFDGRANAERSNLSFGVTLSLLTRPISHPTECSCPKL